MSSPIIVLIGSNFPGVTSGKTAQITFQIVDQNGAPVPASALGALTLTLADTASLENGGPVTIINNVQDVNILNTNRGAVDADGNVVCTLGSVPNQADTALLSVNDPTEQRSAIFEWTYNSGASAWGVRIDFQIVNLGAS